jgi:hypothetical protein
MRYAMRLRERYRSHGRTRIRTVIVTADRPFRVDDRLSADEMATAAGGQIWTRAEWMQDHWFIPRRWGTCELVPPINARITDCG